MTVTNLRGLVNKVTSRKIETKEIQQCAQFQGCTHNNILVVQNQEATAALNPFQLSNGTGYPMEFQPRWTYR